MSTFDKVVVLLGQTEGRDKLLKTLLGVFRVLGSFAHERTPVDVMTDDGGSAAAAVSAVPGSMLSTGVSSVGNSYYDAALCIRTVRSVMRFGKYFADFSKIRSLLDLFRAQGLEHTDNKKFVELAHSLAHALYVLLDNMALLLRFSLLRPIPLRLPSGGGGGRGRYVLDAQRCLRQSRWAQLATSLLSLLFQLFELRDGLRRLEYDPPAAKRAAAKATVSATRDAADVLVTAALLGACESAWCPSNAVAGGLTVLSGCLSTHFNWRLIKM